MIVKFLSKSASFKGVSYNTRKIDKNKGELMKVSGFGPLQGINGLRPKDYINYLKAVSAQNPRVKLPQLHVAISTTGRSHSGEQLTEIAEQWLKEMGYGDQPYLIIFHKDTANNHVHVVSTRVDKQGKKISSAYEKLRAMTALHRVMKLDEVEQAKADLVVALSYNFCTKAQFMLLLEAKGYAVREFDGKLQLIRSAKVVHEFNASLVTDQMKSYVFPEMRQKQMTAIFLRYAALYNTILVQDVVPLPGGLEKKGAGYHSDFSIYLKEAFGWELIFHGQPGKPAYGYTIIDHDQKQVFKGKQVMDLKELLAYEAPAKPVLLSPVSDPIPLSSVVAGSYDALFPDDNIAGKFPISSECRLEAFADQGTTLYAPITISISDDVDDEAIHGRNRQRKRQARTNTR